MRDAIFCSYRHIRSSYFTTNFFYSTKPPALWCRSRTCNFLKWTNHLYGIYPFIKWNKIFASFIYRLCLRLNPIDKPQLLKLIAPKNDTDGIKYPQMFGTRGWFLLTGPTCYPWLICHTLPEPPGVSLAHVNKLLVSEFYCLRYGNHFVLLTADE